MVYTQLSQWRHQMGGTVLSILPHPPHPPHPWLKLQRLILAVSSGRVFPICCSIIALYQLANLGYRVSWPTCWSSELWCQTDKEGRLVVPAGLWWSRKKWPRGFLHGKETFAAERCLEWGKTLFKNIWKVEMENKELQHSEASCSLCIIKYFPCWVFIFIMSGSLMFRNHNAVIARYLS